MCLVQSTGWRNQHASRTPGENRLADAFGGPFKVIRLATGEETEQLGSAKSVVDHKLAKAPESKMTTERGKEIAVQGATKKPWAVPQKHTQAAVALSSIQQCLPSIETNTFPPFPQ